MSAGNADVGPLRLDWLITTAGTQIRAKIDADTVDQYAELMRDTANKFPPVVVFHDGERYLLADGFHRVMATTRNGSSTILADVRRGNWDDALRYALSANVAHGLRRTNSDKRRSVVLALAAWPRLSDRKLAEICAVHHQLVADVRRSELDDSSSSPEPAARIGADGKERKLPAKPKPQQQEPPMADDDDRPHVVARIEAVPAPAPTLQGKRDVQSWYERTNASKRGRFLEYLFSHGTLKVSVPNREKFKARVEQWFDFNVIEDAKEVE
jgi:hypothetical protein